MYFLHNNVNESIDYIRSKSIFSMLTKRKKRKKWRLNQNILKNLLFFFLITRIIFFIFIRKSEANVTIDWFDIGLVSTFKFFQFERNVVRSRNYKPDFNCLFRIKDKNDRDLKIIIFFSVFLKKNWVFL